MDLNAPPRVGVAGADGSTAGASSAGAVRRHARRRQRAWSWPLAAAPLLLGGCYTVNSFVDLPDANPGDGICDAAPRPGAPSSSVRQCTLRAAVMEASSYPLKATVNVPAGTYNLTLPAASGGGRLQVTSSLRLQGSGAGVTIVNQRVGDAVIQVSGGDDVEINHLTLRGGSASAGAGLRIDGGRVEMEDLIIRDNVAFTGGGGLVVATGATAWLRRSSVSGNSASGAFGGGIWNEGSLWVYDSTIDGNEANRAGGIRNGGNLNLRNVTVSGNRANSPQAGVGGISQTGFAVLNNVTLTNNTGVGNVVGSFRGGGIQTSSGAQTVLLNSIVAGNDGGTGPHDCVGALTIDSRNNLIGDANGCTITSYLSTYLLNVPARLGPLAPNGGPSPTHMPLAGSLARDAGYAFPPPAADACEARDQRGVPRPQGAGACDLGAVEHTPANLEVTGFVLVDAATDRDIRPLLNDDLVVVNALSQVSVRAVVGGAPGSVVFGFAGNAAYRTENAAPYTLGGDAAGDYAPVSLGAGRQTLSAIPFVGAGGTGAAGMGRQINLNVIDLSTSDALSWSLDLFLPKALAEAPASQAKAPTAKARVASSPMQDGLELCRQLEEGAGLDELALRASKLMDRAGLKGYDPAVLHKLEPEAEREVRKRLAAVCEAAGPAR